jgi:hypothetical protein
MVASIALLRKTLSLAGRLELSMAGSSRHT